MKLQLELRKLHILIQNLFFKENSLINANQSE